MRKHTTAAARLTPFLFGSGFLHDHVGQIIDDPSIAIVELVANAYDAGAYRVNVEWPDLPGELLSVTDDGTGMTRQQFERRWRTLSYDRITEQGAEVSFPPDAAKQKRTAFGHNGKGRFSAFCYADQYNVETWRDGICTTAAVTMTQGGEMPFVCDVSSEKPKNGHGTRISVIAGKGILPPSHVRELIGFKFGVDPSFSVMVNGEPVQLLQLSRLATSDMVLNDYGTVQIHRVDPMKQERTMRLKGVAWWVNKRMVGEPSWDGLDGPGQYLDGRTSEAKRFSFVVEADFLKDDVETNWTKFKQTSRVELTKKAVHAAIIHELSGLMASDRKAVKKAAIEPHRRLMRDLPSISRNQIGMFLDEIQEKCPGLTPRDLSRTVEIWAKLEQSRSGYDLLRQLAACQPEDLDTWNALMQRWTARSAEVVLSELERRLAVISDLQNLIHDKKSDELHDLQPLFERGLWIFGPEYESVEFTSNRGMSTIVRDFFKRHDVETSRSRPDFVVLPDSSIGLYSANDFSDGEVSGVRKILIIELKRGGFCVTQSELDQAREYAKELRSTGCAQQSTMIEAFVLGARLEPNLQEMTIGERTIIKPFPYDLLLERAHARVFQLHKRIVASKPGLCPDAVIQDVLQQPSLEDAFDGTTAIDV
jgi:hypothetical protein